MKNTEEKKIGPFSWKRTTKSAKAESGNVHASKTREKYWEKFDQLYIVKGKTDYSNPTLPQTTAVVIGNANVNTNFNLVVS